MKCERSTFKSFSEYVFEKNVLRDVKTRVTLYVNMSTDSIDSFSYTADFSDLLRVQWQLSF